MSTTSPRASALSWSRLRRTLLGEPIATSEGEETRLPKRLALPVFSSDAISSVAYATQEILLALGGAGLVAAGAAYGAATYGVTGAIVALLVIVVLSYQQTIHAYPNGGGSYIVSKENLGVTPGLIAAAALLIDYVLTVAVSIASGVQNLVSTPLLAPLAHFVVPVCLFFVGLLLLANLRGQKESGAIFAVPTYLFIGMSYLMILLGVFGPVLGWKPHIEAIATPAQALGHTVQSVTLIVLLRAFANGCSAMTGTEAISNGIPAFKKPETNNAAQTLLWMAAILGTLFIGISYLAVSLHITYTENSHAVIDQLSGAVFGRTGFGAVLYYVMQFPAAAILILAANTSFADFPRLASLLANDGYLPRELAHKGDRLVFSRGIAVLAVASALLLVLFGGNVDRLIPLYALGVFTAFTLSQSGMVLHWRREKGKAWQGKAFLNGVGAVATALVFVIILIEKGPQGAWVVLVAAAAFVWLFQQIHGRYEKIRAAIRFTPGEHPDLGETPAAPPDESVSQGPPPGPVLRNKVIAVVGGAGAHRGLVPALRYARLLSQDFEAVYVELDTERTETVKKEWEEHFPGLPLRVLASPYRSVAGPLLNYIETLHADPTPPAGAEKSGTGGAPPPPPDKDGVHKLTTVVLPEYFTGDLWGFLLQDTTEPTLKIKLLDRDDVVVSNVRHRVFYE